MHREKSNGFENGTVFQRIGKGISANLLGQIINVLNKIALVPFFISNWGTNSYGEWLILTSIVSYLALTDMGGTNYILNRLTQSFSLNEDNEFRKTLKTGIFIFFTLSILIIMLVLLVLEFVPMKPLLSITYTSNYIVNLVILILAFQVSISLLFGLIIGVYRSIGYYAKSIMFSNVVQVMQLVFIVIALVLKCGMVTVALAQIIPLILVGIIACWNLNKRIPSLNLFSMKEIDLKEGKKFFTPSFNFFMIQMSQLFLTQGTILIVGKTLGPTAVVTYTLARTLINIIRQVLGIVINSSKPEMTRLDIQNKDRELAEIFKKITQMTLTIGCIIGILLHFGGEEIYRLWLKDTSTFDQSLMDLLLVYIILLTFWFGFADFLMAVNRHKKLSIVILVSSVLNVIFAILGANILGLNGIVLGLITGDLVLACWLIPYLAIKYKPIMNSTTILKQISLFIIFLLNIIFNNISIGVITLIILLYIFIINMIPNIKVSTRFR